MNKSGVNLTISQLDAAVEAKISKAVEEAESKKTKRILNLTLNSTCGSSEIALSVLSKVHGSEYTDMHVKASGSIGVGGTLLTAGAEFGHRIAEFGTTFRILENDPTDEGADLKSNKQQDKLIIDTLKILTGKIKLLDETIKTSCIVNFETAKKLNFIDNMPKFKSKYRGKKAKQNVITDTENT